jgi:HK97 family phage prohead protease
MNKNFNYDFSIKSFNQDNKNLLEKWKGCTYYERLENFDEEKEFLIEGFGVSFNNIDRDGDLILPNAMDGVLNKFYNKVDSIDEYGNNLGCEIRLLSQHKRDQLPLGYVCGIKKTEQGLEIIAKCSKIGEGLNIYENIKMAHKDGALKEYIGISFNLIIDKYKDQEISKKMVRIIEQISFCNEFSIVTDPANVKSRITQFKSFDKENNNITITTRLLSKLISEKFSLNKQKSESLIKNFYEEKFLNEKKCLLSEIEILKANQKEVSKPDFLENIINQIKAKEKAQEKELNDIFKNC